LIDEKACLTSAVRLLGDPTSNRHISRQGVKGSSLST
jgi:hypothetical protein